jgi:hypothetical protein
MIREVEVKKEVLLNHQMIREVEVKKREWRVACGAVGQQVAHLLADLLADLIVG